MKKESINEKIILSLSIILMISAMVIPYEFLFGLTVFGFIILLLFDRKAYREFGNLKFWLFLFVIVIVIPTTIGEKDSNFYFIKFSSENLALGIQMTLRSFCIYTGVILITRNISIGKINDILGKLRLFEFSYIIPIGLNIIPIIRRNFFQIVTVFKLRGGFKRNIFKNIFKFLLALLINTIKVSEEVAQIIELNQTNRK
jgi:energy-coupling factor transporter transmembrane protein EcfT